MSQMLRITMRFKKEDLPWEEWMAENNPIHPDITSEYERQLRFADTFSNVMASEYSEYMDIEVEDEDFFVDETLNVSGRDEDRVREMISAMWRELSTYFPVDAQVQFIEHTPLERYEYREKEYAEMMDDSDPQIQPNN